MQKTIYNFLRDYGFFFLVCSAACFGVRLHGMFWDTVQLAGKHGYWYYDTDFQHFLLPVSLDSGHPPLFGLYLAAMWSLLGKSLMVSHFAILPFTCISIYAIGELGRYFLDKRWWYAPTVLLLDPTFAAQNVLVSPDALLVAFFLTSVFAIVKQKRFLLAFSCTLLALISMRGMMCVATLYFFYSYHRIFYTSTASFRWVQLIKYFLPFSIATLLAGAFLLYHYLETGWIGYHADSPWAASFEKVNIEGFFKNILLLGWRILDFGRIFEVVICVVLWIIARKTLDVKISLLFVLLFWSFVFLVPSTLLHKSLSAHRYLLPIFVCIHLITLRLLVVKFQHRAIGFYLFLLVNIGFLTGNLWKYDKFTAQGWDASLAHLPYYSLREQAIEYLDEKGIPLEKVGTVFPEVGARKFRALNDREDGFKQADLQSDNYIFYATTMNDFSNETLMLLEKDWKVEKTWKKFGIEVILYQRP